MRSKGVVARCLVALCLFPAVGDAVLARAPRRARTAAFAKLLAAPHAPGELMVKLRERSGKVPLDALAVAGVRVDEQMPLDPALVRVSVDGDLAGSAAALAADPRVLYVEPNYLYAPSAVPNDPGFASQWGLADSGAAGSMRAEAAWDVTTGSDDVVVAVIDTGIDLTHPDLVDNIYRNPGEVAGNGADDDHDGYVDDVSGWNAIDDDGTPQDTNGHGTHVSGILGARGDNGIGVAGVCWNVKIMPLRFIGRNVGKESDAIKCFDYAVAARGRGVNVRVANCSWGAFSFSQALDDAVARANRAGILVVCAAGNEAADTDVSPNYPSASDLPNVVSVGALGVDGKPAWFSNRGRQTVDVFAPGLGILSTLPGGTYGHLSGTSMASPMVAGLAALVLAAHPDATTAQLKARLVGAAHAGSPNYLDGACLTDGLVLAPLALREDAVPPAAPADFHLTSASADGASVAWTAVGDDGAAGAASYYDIRWSASPITDASFEAAAQLYDARMPMPAGRQEAASVASCLAGGARYLAMRVYDKAGNFSETASLEAAATPAPDYDVVAAEPGGPADDGTVVADGDDAVVRVDLPFDFPFEGAAHRAMFVSTNGYVTFDAPMRDIFAEPDALAAHAAIAPLWTDMYSSVTMTATDEVASVTWRGRLYQDVLKDPALDPYKRPIVVGLRLHRDGLVEFVYPPGFNRDLEQYGASPVVAIADGCAMRTIDGYDRMASLHASPSFGLRPRPSDGGLPPSLSVAGFPGSVLEGETVTATVTASDPEGGPVTLAASDLGTGALDAARGVYTYTPASDEAGTRRILFTATDASGHATTETVVIEVRDNPGLPEVRSVAVGKKKIAIAGDHFAAGARVFVNGVEASGVAAEPTKLTVRGGRALFVGVDDAVVVVNPDGARSNVFVVP